MIEKKFLKSTFLPIWDLLEDETINEIKINPIEHGKGAVWAKKGGSWFECKTENNDVIVLAEAKINQIIEYIAGVEDKFAHDKQNILEASIPLLGYRFTGIKSPASIGCPKFNIRKFNPEIFTDEDYIKFGTYPEHVAELISSWADNVGQFGSYEKFSIGVFGVTDSGKTSWMNFFINKKMKRYPSENWVILEDTRELILPYGCIDRLQCTQYHNMNDLIITSKRLTPDNLVIGEVRGGEAAYVIESALISNTIFGMHAKSFKSALSSLEKMILKNEFTDSVDKRDLCNINGWVGFQNVPSFIEDKHGNEVRTYKKRMTEMVELKDYDTKKDEWQYTSIYKYVE